MLDNGTGFAPADAILALFAAVGNSFIHVETSAQGLEHAVVEAFVKLKNEPLKVAVDAAEVRLHKAFDMLREAVASARAVVTGAMADADYGLGPGYFEMNADLRRALAAAGGLSSHNLTLLSITSEGPVGRLANTSGSAPQVSARKKAAPTSAKGRKRAKATSRRRGPIRSTRR